MYLHSFSKSSFVAVATYLLLVTGVAARCFRDPVVSALSCHATAARSFCSEFIRPVVTAPTAPCTVTVTHSRVIAFLTPTVTQFVTSTVTITEDVTITTTSSASFAKRAVALPSYVSQYGSSRISSACSCLVGSVAASTVTTSCAASVDIFIGFTSYLPPITRTIATATTTVITHTATTTAPACNPINGCIKGGFFLEPYNNTNPNDCHQYCQDFPCFSYQVGRNASGNVVYCNLSGVTPSIAYNPNPTGTVEGIGADCGNFYIYDRNCPYQTGLP